MPKLLGSSVRVVDINGFSVDEFAGNVSTKDDTLSIAYCRVTEPTSEPWLTLHYDEWLAVTRGRIELHSPDGTIVSASAGETAFVAKGERFRPVFPEPNSEYVPICIPAFKPERCIREEETETSSVSQKLNELHHPTTNGTTTTATTAATTTKVTNVETLYHMCQKELWDQALSNKTAYYPPTFVKDGNFTHATAVPARLIETANHFYTDTKGDWICIELSNSALRTIGIQTVFEEAKPVGTTNVKQEEWSEWQCPHIYGGIPAFLPGIVTKTYPMTRDADGNFLKIDFGLPATTA